MRFQSFAGPQTKRLPLTSTPDAQLSVTNADGPRSSALFMTVIAAGSAITSVAPSNAAEMISARERHGLDDLCVAADQHRAIVENRDDAFVDDELER